MLDDEENVTPDPVPIDAATAPVIAAADDESISAPEQKRARPSDEESPLAKPQIVPVVTPAAEECPQSPSVAPTLSPPSLPGPDDGCVCKDRPFIYVERLLFKAKNDLFRFPTVLLSEASYFFRLL